MKKQLINKFKVKEIYHNEKKNQKYKSKIKFLKISIFFEWKKLYSKIYSLFVINIVILILKLHDVNCNNLRQYIHE